MTVERWRQIEAIYHSALDRSFPERATFIAEACKDDLDLRKEVEDLVRREESPGWSLRDSPIWAVTGAPAAPLSAGERLGPYEIVENIGSGGMGLVYRAIDTRLGRSVAIKTSRGPFTGQFAREARTIASLNHPNICTLYDTGPDYLVMELIDGSTLAERIRKGALPLDEALRIARQVAAAIDTAHENGIIHRDLKPANIKVRSDGSVKVLDFGLAKPTTRSEPAPESLEIQRSGMILGTAAYMSPEQALGQDVDKRSDVWAFGVVFFEMLAGTRPFQGDTVSDCMADIVRREPDLTKVPEPVRRLLRLCLEKDPVKRLRSLGDWERFIDHDEPALKSSAVSPFRGIAWLVLAAILITAAAVGMWSTWFRPAGPLHTTRFQLPMPDNVQFDEYVAVSPDGRKLVFNSTGGQSGLWIRDLDKLEWRRLEGTEGGGSQFWSPDSRYVGFSVPRHLKKIDINAGPPQTLCTVDGWPGLGAWSKDGVIIFGGHGIGGIRKVTESGGAVTDLTIPDASGSFHNIPSFLPDQKHFLYLNASAGDREGVYVGSLDSAPAAQSRERLIANRLGANYVDGNLLYVRDGTLLSQPFDAAALVLRGSPVHVADHVGVIRHYSVFSASPNTLAYRTGKNTNNEAQLSWFDRDGKLISTVGPPNNAPRVSPDATHAAVRDAENNANGDIWIIDFATGGHRRLTFRQAPGSWPSWSPDGRSIFFAAGRDSETIFEKSADGAGAEKEWLTEPGIFHQITGSSPDNHFLLYHAGPPKKMAIWALTLDASRRRVLLLGGEFNAANARLSPDGRWIAYISNESGQPEIYVRPFVASGTSALSLGEGKWQVSKNAARIVTPRWRSDGKEIFFMDGADVIQAVQVDGSHSAFQIGVSKPLLTTPCNCGWDMTPDGQRFLVRYAAGVGGNTPITVVLNWQSELKTR